MNAQNGDDLDILRSPKRWLELASLWEANRFQQIASGEFRYNTNFGVSVCIQ